MDFARATISRKAFNDGNLKIQCHVIGGPTSDLCVVTCLADAGAGDQKVCDGDCAGADLRGVEKSEDGNYDLTQIVKCSYGGQFTCENMRTSPNTEKAGGSTTLGSVWKPISRRTSNQNTASTTATTEKTSGSNNPMANLSLTLFGVLLIKYIVL